MNTPPVLNFGYAPGDGYFSSSYVTGVIQSAAQQAVAGGVTGAENSFIQWRVQNAAGLLTSEDCAGLFLTPDQNTQANRALLSQELAQDGGSFMLMSSALAAAANEPANVPAFTVGGATWIIEGGAFFTGQAQTSTGSYAPLGGWAQGLSLTAFDETTVIHEFMHQLGIVGPDVPLPDGSQPTFTLPNGDTVAGSAGISLDVRDKCLK